MPGQIGSMYLAGELLLEDSNFGVRFLVNKRLLFSDRSESPDGFEC